MEEKPQFYDFSTPVTEDMTLTAVWNDTPNPNEPTFENLRLALLTKEPWKYYPIGTEIPHKDTAGVDNPWVVLHYGLRNAVGEGGEAAETTSTFGAIIGLKYCDSTWRGLRYAAAQNANNHIIPMLKNVIEPLIPAAEKEYFRRVDAGILGDQLIWIPTSSNIKYGTEETWEYYNQPAQYYERIRYTSTRSNNPTGFDAKETGFSYMDALNKVGFINSRTYPTTAGFTSVNLSTTDTGVYPRLCAFVAAPDESPLNQPKES